MGETRESWPDWPIKSEAVEKLVDYISPEKVAGWLPGDVVGAWSSLPGQDSGVKQIRKVYEAVRAARIPYTENAPWNPASDDTDGNVAHQSIRSHEETIAGPATCLDLTLLGAALAIAADLRVWLAVRTGQTDARHACLVVDIRISLRGASDQAARDELAEEFRGGQLMGVWHAATDKDIALRAGRYLVVEMVGAAERQGSSGGVPFERACCSSLKGEPAARWSLVDVAAVKHALNSPHPQQRADRPIHGYLPTRPSFRQYQQHVRLREEIIRAHRGRRWTNEADESSRPAPARLILQAAAGYGKSMLAHQVAQAADNGHGWFLNASDERTLIASLAAAERQERNQIASDEQDAVEQRQLAGAALDRLRNAKLPWVVVIDNCDLAPDQAPSDFFPVPVLPGQLLIITTQHADWEARAQEMTEKVEPWGLFRSVPSVSKEELNFLRVPEHLYPFVDGRPLIAEAVLAASDTEIPCQLSGVPGDPGAALVWSWFRQRYPSAVPLARSLAWAPSEPVRPAAVRSKDDDAAEAADQLIAARLVDGAGSGATQTVQMHRLFAEVIRETTWHELDEAFDAVSALLLTQDGRFLLSTTPDQSAIKRLEAEAVPRLERETPAAGGRLWFGIGHVCERRGPVRDSGPLFKRALDDLDRNTYPDEAAEALIGLARVINQNPDSTPADLEAAKADINAAQELLTGRDSLDARQQWEQGNALHWVIEGKLASALPEQDRRSVDAKIQRQHEVIHHLWTSYERRLRLRRGLTDDASVRREPPRAEDGLGPERAYYNLAGAHLGLAQTIFRRGPDQDLPTLRWKEDVKSALDESDRIYCEVEKLRRKKYYGRAHPHHASCNSGRAIIAYYRAIMLGPAEILLEAAEFCAQGLQERTAIARSSLAVNAAELGNGDVRKSLDLQIKIAVAARALSLDGDEQFTRGREISQRQVDEALEEMTRGHH